MNRQKSAIAKLSREQRQSYMAKLRRRPPQLQTIPHVPAGSLPEPKDAEEHKQ